MRAPALSRVLHHSSQVLPVLARTEASVRVPRRISWNSFAIRPTLIFALPGRAIRRAIRARSCASPGRAGPEPGRPAVPAQSGVGEIADAEFQAPASSPRYSQIAEY